MGWRVYSKSRENLLRQPVTDKLKRKGPHTDRASRKRTARTVKKLNHSSQSSGPMRPILMAYFTMATML